MRCPRCGKDYPDFARFCPACGTPFDEERGSPDGCLTLFAILIAGVVASVLISAVW